MPINKELHYYSYLNFKKICIIYTDLSTIKERNIGWYSSSI